MISFHIKRFKGEGNESSFGLLKCEGEEFFRETSGL